MRFEFQPVTRKERTAGGVKSLQLELWSKVHGTKRSTNINMAWDH